MAVVGSCHCGAIEITLESAPAQVTHCNCSLCRRYGVLWAYAPKSEVTLTPAVPATDTYAWGGRNVDFHRCANCGCVTHWWPRSAKRDRMGINIRMFDTRLIENAEVIRKDSSETGLFH